MTFYEQETIRIRDQFYPKNYLMERIILAKQFMDKQCAETNLDNVAAQAFLSKFHFIRIFSRCYGRTPYRYLTETRIAKAKQLLRSGLSTNDICYSLGFESTTSFIALFKKETGATPVAYKKSNF